jgi:acetoin utilization deacetylase AcuC-like enzyme
MNLPLPQDSTPGQWFAALETACVKMQMFGPQALVVSLGVNTPGLSGADFLRIGERIGYLGLPTVFVFEGGDSTAELGINVVNVLEGFETAA